VARNQFGEYTSNRPNVDGGTVTLLSEENLGSTVPQGDDFVCVGSDRNAKGSGQAKVGKLDDTLAIN